MRAVQVGAALLVVAFAVAIIGSALTLGRLNQSALSRDVIVDGDRITAVPGRLVFSVSEPLSDDADPRMHVGIGTRIRGGSQPSCEMQRIEGDRIKMNSVASETAFVDRELVGVTPVAAARLSPGRYEARCEWADGSGGPDSGEARFTVGRVVGMGDLTGELAPVLWFGGVLLLAGAFFVGGGITLAIGLVRRSRAR